MVIRIPTPSDVLGLAKSTVGWAVESATAVAALPGRVLGLVDGAEALLTRVQAVADRADELVQRTTRTAEDAEALLRDTRAVADAARAAVADAGRIAATTEGLVNRAGGVTDEAAKTIVEAQRATSTADGLLAAYAPMARRFAPLADRFVDELSDKEVDAAIRLVDELPVLTEHVLRDVLPILRTLDRVGPEIHELLEVTHDVRRAIVGIPGFQFFRRRGEERVSEEEVAKPQADHYGPGPAADSAR
ncbi:hypothetical protein HUO13_23550 [Saccharopolyspora erythraea]|uniref:hypothetical protein n=1 Tax=Saccharopolyspora erythraea TaxID=1836 RepID=UPI001BA91EE8|nr:hypothetical protein [Saccharopolyspora erythraea]QUH03404.1 hypothetical protein HUO13_23550 [Saccharopolyspora erythraea]